MIAKLWRLLKPFHKTFGWYAGLILVYELLQIVEGYVLSGTIRLYNLRAPIILWAAFVIGLLIYDELFMRLDNQMDWFIISRHIYPIAQYLKTSALGKFLGMDMAWHQEHNSGTLVGKVNGGVEKVQNILEGASWEAYPAITQALLSLIALLIFTPLTALAATVTLTLFLWLSSKAVRARQPLREERFDLYEQEWHKSLENVQFVETSIMFGQQQRQMDEYKQMHKNISELGLREARMGIFHYNRWRIRLITWTRRAILVMWAVQLTSGRMDLATLVYASVLTEKLFSTFWRMARLMDRAAESAEGAQRLSGLMDEKSDMVESSQGQIATSDKTVGIELQNVTFNYPGSTGGLENVSLSISPGEMVALVGQSGSGKTTLRKLITRIYDVQQGQILVNGTDIRTWPLSQLRNLFAYVPQGDDVHIFNDTIINNIRFSKPSATNAQVEKAARLAGIHNTIMDNLPKAYETMVGERGIKLSGGQKQRIALARAFLADRPVLILDEATSAVDAITEREIQEQLKIALKGRTAIVIAHRLSTIWGIADKIVVLDKGQKVEEGSHKQLLNNKRLYARMVELQT